MSQSHAEPTLPAPTHLEAIRAKRAALRDQLAATAAVDADDRLVAAEELAYANEQAVAAAVAKLGPIGTKIDTLETHLGVIIVRRPAASAFKEYSELDGPKITFDVLESYARKVIEYPALPAYDAITKELPGIVPDLVIKANQLMGARAREQAKK